MWRLALAGLGGGDVRVLDEWDLEDIAKANEALDAKAAAENAAAREGR